MQSCSELKIQSICHLENAKVLKCRGVGYPLASIISAHCPACVCCIFIHITLFVSVTNYPEFSQGHVRELTFNSKIS